MPARSLLVGEVEIPYESFQTNMKRGVRRIFIGVCTFIPFQQHYNAFQQHNNALKIVATPWHSPCIRLSQQLSLTLPLRVEFLLKTESGYLIFFQISNKCVRLKETNANFPRHHLSRRIFGNGGMFEHTHTHSLTQACTHTHTHT